jgi:hypothetical protein
LWGLKTSRPKRRRGVGDTFENGDPFNRGATHCAQPSSDNVVHLFSFPV